MAAAPDFIRFVKQTGYHGDCSISALGMLTGTLYEDVLIAAASVNPTVLQTGMTWPQMRKVASLLGVVTRLARKYDITEDTGVLNVVRGKDDHVVFLWEGRIIDGNGEMWIAPDGYLKQYGYTAGALLIAVE